MRARGKSMLEITEYSAIPSLTSLNDLPFRYGLLKGKDGSAAEGRGGLGERQP